MYLITVLESNIIIKNLIEEILIEELQEGGLYMKLRDIMNKDVIAVARDTSIYDAAQIMKDKNIGAVPICTDGMDVEGIITDRDIVLRVVCAGKDPKKTRCGEVMTDRITVGKTDMEVESALELMGDVKVRRLPVVEEGKLVGFVALGDMAVNSRFDSKAEEALSEISTPSQPRM